MGTPRPRGDSQKMTLITVLKPIYPFSIEVSFSLLRLTVAVMELNSNQALRPFFLDISTAQTFEVW